MDKFIYVFCAEDCERLKQMGYPLLRSDVFAGVYIFQNVRPAEKIFSIGKFILTDTLIL